MNSVTGRNLTSNKDFACTFFTQGDVWVADLVPQRKEMKQMFSTIRLRFDSKRRMVSQVEMNEKRGDVTIITLKDIKTNEAIHQNQFTDPKYRGAQMFYYKDNAESAGLAECLRARIKGFLQPQNERETKAVNDELYLLCNCRNPAVMSECGFISNPEEAALLEQEPYRRQMSFTLMCGLNDFHIESGRISAKNAEIRR